MGTTNFKEFMTLEELQAAYDEILKMSWWQRITIATQLICKYKKNFK